MVSPMSLEISVHSCLAVFKKIYWYLLMNFKKENSFDKRVELSKRLLQQHPNRVPIIVESISKKLSLNKDKYLVPGDSTIGSFLGEIRKNAIINSQEAIFLFGGKSGNILMPATNTMDQIYERYKDDDGFLYIRVAIENTFGIVYYADIAIDSFLSYSSGLVKAIGLDKLL